MNMPDYYIKYDNWGGGIDIEIPFGYSVMEFANQYFIHKLTTDCVEQNAIFKRMQFVQFCSFYKKVSKPYL
jgi:hypothetical protein